MLSVRRYFERIGLTETAELAEIHRAHVCAIPFENLDPHRGVAVSVAPEALAEKLVAARRGGYCFEQNLLLKAVLERLGFRVDPLLARVRWNAPAGTVPARAHLVLRVHTGGAVWHADVGFGAGTLLEPIPFGAGGPYEQSGWRFRVVEESDQLVLQTDVGEEWRDLYEFAPVASPMIDVEMANWFTSTHPRSRFVTGLIISTQLPDGTRISLSDWNELALAIRTPTESRVTPVEREAVPRLLEEHFGLRGFTLDAAKRIVPPGA